MIENSLAVSEENYRRKMEVLEHDYATRESLGWENLPRSRFVPRFVEELQGRFGERPEILDLGSGSGERAISLAELGLDVVGLEMTGSGVRRASTNALKHQSVQVGNTSFVQGDMRNLPFLDMTFVGFHDFLSLMHLPFKDWERYFDGVVRILRPGGLGLIVTFSGEDVEYFGVPIKDDDIGWLEFKDGFVNLEERSGSRFSRPHNYPERYEGYNYYFASKDEILSMAGGRFNILEMDLCSDQIGNPDHRGKRFYWNILLEKR